MNGLNLPEVWNYLESDVKRAITVVARDNDYLRTRTLLPALAVASRERGETTVLREILDESELEFRYPSDLPDPPESVPEPVEMTPAVEETLNFFRLNQIRSVTSYDLARRLLEIGTGSTVLSLEEEGLLDEAIKRLGSIPQDKSSSS